MIGNWSADYPDPDDFAKPFGDYSQKSLAWRLGWDDPTLSQMAQKAGTLPNGPERDQLYKQINDYAMQQSPFAILYQPLLRDAMSSQVQDFYDNPIFGLDMIHVRKQ